ncbi:hypothetical protein [Insolitispirillum peregrinum]|uniref:hypothetical protein n=1 Tax=Insolitispirillum peregrinum TaxID=80876 RepID=UPI0009708021|nr:hypothetical protein [Insolitispirillum peregrinum]
MPCPFIAFSERNGSWEWRELDADNHEDALVEAKFFCYAPVVIAQTCADADAVLSEALGLAKYQADPNRALPDLLCCVLGAGAGVW